MSSKPLMPSKRKQLNTTKCVLKPTTNYSSLLTPPKDAEIDRILKAFKLDA